MRLERLGTDGTCRVRIEPSWRLEVLEPVPRHPMHDGPVADVPALLEPGDG
jgi:hypothetical protein